MIRSLIRTRFILAIGISGFYFLFPFSSKAQILVTTTQNLSFGAFTNGSSGGAIVISSAGTRSVTGDVIPVNLGYLYFPAIFEIEAPVSSVINIVNGPDTELTGSNGGSMMLHIGNADPASPFVTSAPPPSRNIIRIGGTLNVSGTATNLPGTYNGSFSITFIQE
jgi:hypothetical protein